MKARSIFEARPVAELVGTNALKRKKRRARRRALQRFARLHPYWYESLFDEALLDRVPDSVLEQRDPTMLAREWSRRFRYRDGLKREREIQQLAPVAESFIELLAFAEEELGVARHEVGTRVAVRAHERVPGWAAPL